MPIDVPPSYPPAIVESVGDYNPHPPFPDVISGPLFPSEEDSLGCPPDTHRVVVPFGRIICRIDPSRTSVQPTRVLGDEPGLDLLNSFRWAAKLIEQQTQTYPEVLSGTGAVKIITIDPTKAAGTYFGWGQIVRVGDEESAVITTQHVMDDENLLYLILNENGFVVRTSSQIVRIPAGGSSITEDASVNLVMISEDEVERFLPSGVEMVKLGVYDNRLPAYMVNTVSGEFPVFTDSLIPVIVGEREEQTIIFMLGRSKAGSINNLCVGVSGSSIIQLVPKLNGIGAEAVLVAFASSLPPEDISKSPVNPVFGRRCAPANTALRVPVNASVNLDTSKRLIREWGNRSNYNWLKTYTWRSQG